MGNRKEIRGAPTYAAYASAAYASARAGANENRQRLQTKMTKIDRGCIEEQARTFVHYTMSWFVQNGGA